MTEPQRPPARDPDDTASRLSEWLDADVEVTGVPEGTGYSHETILFRARGESLVARVEPTGHTVFPDADLEREYRIMATLAERDEVPLPELRGFEEDPSVLGAPFMVMTHLEGDVPPDSPPYTMAGWLSDATPRQRELVWWAGLDAMAAVHSTPREDVESLLSGNGIDDQLDYWAGYLEWCGARGAHPVAERTYVWLAENVPGSEETGFCWGDSRIGNQMFSSGRCVAVLDWEMATIADPVMDLAWFCYFDEVFSEGLGVPRLDGIPGRDATVAAWESRTGREARHLDYYTVFAAFRFTTILYRLGGLMKLYGRLAPDDPFQTDNFAAAHLAGLLEEMGA